MNVIKNVQLKNEVFILSNRNLVLTTCYGKKRTERLYPTSTLTHGEFTDDSFLSREIIDLSLASTILLTGNLSSTLIIP